MAGKEYVLPEASGYRMIRRLGSGGEGTVYLVCHIRTEQLRAAKVLTNIRENCRHELDMMKNLNHPSLPKVIDILEEGENTWLIMEYIQGCRLDQAVSRGLGKKQFWFVADHLAQVLVYLHSRKKPVLHLDIKPSNILLRPDGSLVLIDFGASIRGHPDECVNSGYGTPGFAAPEQQLKGALVDGRTDLFGAGAVLYYCRYGKTPDLDINRHRRSRLDRILMKCLEKEPQKRYADSQEFYRAICRARRAEKRKRILCESFGAGVLLVLSGFLLFSDLQSGQMTGLSISAESSIVTASGYGVMGEAGKFAGSETEAVERENAGMENETENKELTDKANVTGGREAAGVEKEAGDEEAEPEENGEKSDSETNRKEYSRLLNMAAGLGFVQAIECYRNASALFPADEEWYLCLIAQMTADGLFEESEEEVLKELIYSMQPGNSSTALELLEENAQSYGLVTYRLGLAYWYFYEGSGGKSAAAWWFQKSLASQENSSESWTSTAEILARIGSYYGMLGSTDMDEERLRIEWNYWTDLQELWRLYLSQQEDEKICCENAEELLSLLVLHAYDLRQNGESEEAMKEVISDIEEYLAEDFLTVDDTEPEKLKDMVRAANEAIERAFQD
ncbi:MAG: serine/threonine protein kinase [Clostridiales bacterium]|nr:serine/threonine protein kinase [Clostridiales bacterium]